MSLSTDFNGDVEALRAELRKKEHDLLLAARYGKSLLEENEQLKRDLDHSRHQHASVNELRETQRRDSQRSLMESRRAAEQHISELEQQLTDLRDELARERAAMASTREENQRASEELSVENTQLRENLTKACQELEGERVARKEVNRKLAKSEKSEKRLTIELTELNKQLEVYHNSNKSLNEDVSSLSGTCDKLSTELANCRDEIEYWEKKYCDKDEELHTCTKDLDDSHEQLKQMQIEMDQQSSYTPKSMRSESRTASLYDELSSSHDSLALSYMGLIHAEDMSSTCGSDLVEREDNCTAATEEVCSPSCTPLVQRTETDVVEPEKRSEKITCGWEEGDVFHCPRCKELKAKLSTSEQELKWVNEQLLLAVQQKFKLQQQIEEWQTDMTHVVQEHVHQKLVKGALKNRSKSKSGKHEPPKRQLSWQLVKDSLVF